MADSTWRKNREKGWIKDIGYELLVVIQSHRYDTRKKGSKPNDPGWHECSCGWEGYWSQFEPHVADHLREIATERLASAWQEPHDHLCDSGPFCSAHRNPFSVPPLDETVGGSH